VANAIARKLRSNSTDAERKLWRYLRTLKSQGFHFRRQVPIDGFIVDFACYSARLVIELDGGQHNVDEQARTDRARDRHLESQRFKVLRFWNDDVLRNAEGVMEHIMPALSRSTPIPNPSPQGGGEHTERGAT
jgi:very-short-patch-repair endonuclease